VTFYVIVKKPEEKKIKFKIRVRDYETGDTIPGAKVVIYADKNKVGEQLTGSDGVTPDWFYVKEGAWVTGTVEKKGYVTANIEGFYATKDYDGQTITVYLTPETLKGDLTIVVKDYAGNRIDATVWMWVDGKWANEKKTVNGEVTYKDLPYGSYKFKAKSDKYGDKIFVVTLDEPEKTYEVQLGSPMAKVEFYVYHKTDKKPIVGASVHLWSKETGFDKTLTTGSDGHADFGEVNPGFYEYEITKEGYVPYKSHKTFEAGKTYTIEVYMITEEEAKYPQWVVMLAQLLGISPEQARLFIMGLLALIVLSFVMSIFK